MPKTKPRYQPHPGLSREAAAMEKLREKTGRSYDEWVALAKKSGPKKQDPLRDWLRSKHGFSSMYAMWVAAAAASDDQPSYEDPEKLVAALYSGPRSALRPLHERVVDAVLALGDDVIVTSCKTMVPFYRKHVFAQARPVEGGVEVQIALGDAPAPKRFATISGRMPGDRLSHRTVLASPKDLDSAFTSGLRAAYEAGAAKIARAGGELKVPADLEKQLKGKARATWESCTPAMRRDIILWVEAAKQAETRERRVARAIERLEAGHKKLY